MNEIATIHAEQQAMTREQIDLLKRTVAKGASDDEFALFIQLCKARGLDPFCRQIHYTRNGTITGIDGFRVIAERTGHYCPGDTHYIEDKDGNLIAAQVSVRKQVGNEWFTVTETAYLNEYKASTPIWQKMPRVMVAKCAEARALRRAFPAELSGLYATEEMDQAVTHEQHEPVMKQVEQPKPVEQPQNDRIGKCLELFESVNIGRVALENSIGKQVQEWGKDEIRSLGILWKQAEKIEPSWNMRSHLWGLLFPEQAEQVEEVCADLLEEED